MLTRNVNVEKHTDRSSRVRAIMCVNCSIAFTSYLKSTVLIPKYVYTVYHVKFYELLLDIIQLPWVGYSQRNIICIGKFFGHMCQSLENVFVVSVGIKE